MAGHINATISSHNNGYPHDIEDIKALGEIGTTFQLETASVGRFSSTIKVVGNPKSFNSVNFTFTWDADGTPADIYSIREFSEYITWDEIRAIRDSARNEYTGVTACHPYHLTSRIR